jgi:hypothetical protein
MFDAGKVRKFCCEFAESSSLRMESQQERRIFLVVMLGKNAQKLFVSNKLLHLLPLIYSLHQLKINCVMSINWLAVIVAALVPTVVGFIWYNPRVFGNTWMKAADMTDEKVKGGNMPLIFGLSFVFSLMLAMVMNNFAIHQMNVPGIFQNELGDPNSEGSKFVAEFMAKYGTNFRTFSHGAVHGTIAGLFFALPVLATNAMFERKGFKYIAVNGGYWILTLALMGAIVCGWM